MRIDPAELAQTLFEEAGDALFLFDPEGEQVLDVNPTAQRLTGCARQELLKFPITYLFRSEAPHGMQRLRHAFKKTGAFHSQDGFLLRRMHEGAWIPVNLTISRLHSEPRTLGLVTARDVREQRQTLDQLQRAEAELRRVVGVVQCYLYSATIDASGRSSTNYVSPAVERFTGRPPAFFKPGVDAWLSIVHPSDRDQLKATLRAALAACQAQIDVVYRIVWPDGAIRWVRDSLSATYHADRSIQIDGVVTDITTSKTAEQALQQTTEHLRAIIETTPECVKIVARDGTLLDMNSTGVKMLGAERREQVIGKNLAEFVCPEHLADVLDFHEKVCQGHTGEVRVSVNTLHGERRIMECRGAPLHVQGDPHPLNLCISQDVTERIRAEEALRASEEKYRTLVETTHELIWSVDTEGRWSFVNRNGARRFLGCEPEEAIGRPFSEFLPPENRELAARQFREMPNRHELFNLEAALLRKDGSRVEVLVNSRRLRDAEGKFLGVTGTSMDITGLKRTEAALAARERNYRLLIERNLAGYFRSNPEGKILECNEAFARMLGYSSREEVLSVSTGNFYCDPKERSELLKLLEVEGNVHYCEGLRRCRDGSLIWVLQNITRLNNENGEVFYEGTAIDITERKRVEEAIRASEVRYRTLLENLEQCIFLKDRSLRFVAANRPFCRSLGLQECEIIGKTDFDLYPPDLAAKYRKDDLLVIEEGRRLEQEEENMDGDRRRIVRVIKTPLRGGQGEIQGVLCIFWDVSEQRAMEEQLRQSQKMEGIGQLAGGIAHDFNNLLQAVLGNTSLALAGMSPADPNRSLIQAAEAATLRASDLVRKLLGFSRKTVLHLESVRLNDVVTETLEIFRRGIDPNIRLDLRLDPAIGTVRADPSQMGQVIMNLCLNARDAMLRGGRLTIATADVEISEEEARLHVGARPGPAVRLIIHDTGHGMTPEIRARIFEPYFTTKEMGKGTGLGLAMVFGILQQHNGWIECQSEPGAGTTFTFWLPRETVPLPRSQPLPTPKPLPGQETILFVEDEPVVRTLARQILERYGYKVLLADDGLAGLEVYRQQRERIDLVILDLTMPRLSGQETLEELAKLDPDVRVIFSSGYSAEPPISLEHPNVVGFVGKPYKPDQLAATVRQALDRSAATDTVTVAIADDRDFR